MNAYVKSYATFVAFLLVTKIVVAPLAKSMNVPYLSDL
jgi:hypothetical protein